MSTVEYNKNFDKKLKDIVCNLFNKNLKITRIHQGEVNYSYKITDERDIPVYYARILRYQGHPDIEKLSWISEELKRKRIPQSLIVYSDKTSKHFPNGFMVSEWIEGKNGWEAIKDGDYSLGNITLQTSKLLSKIHQIEVSGFGWLYGKGLSNYNSFEDRILSIQKKDEYKNLINEGVLEKDILKRSMNSLKNSFKKVILPKQPVLVHSDPTPDNIIVKKDGSLVLVDWDDSEGSWWVRDYAYIRYWSDKKDIIKDYFFKGYNNISITESEIEIAELIEWILQSLRLLPYYRYYFVDERKYIQAKERLLIDLRTLERII